MLCVVWAYHVAQLAFPRAGVFGGAGAEPPALADLVRHLLADQLGRPSAHSSTSRIRLDLHTCQATYVGGTGAHWFMEP